MDQYLFQLVEDFEAAAQKVPTMNEVRERFNIEIPEELEMFAYAEMYLRVPPQKFSDIVGIEKVALPPPRKLSPSQTTFLCSEIIRLLHAYYFHPDFPERLPAKIKYRLLYDHWEHKYAFTGEGTVHIEFCTYEIEECPYPKEFCMCKEFMDDP